MTQKIINTGIADKGNGDPIRTAFTKVNDNFAELYSQLAASVVVSATAPTGPEEGSLWWNSESGRMYVYYGTAWVDASPVDGAGISSTNELVNGAHTVSLGSDGVLTLPNGSTIGDGEAGVGVPITTARGTILLGNLAECAGGESHFHIMKAGQQAIDLFLGDDSNYVKLPDTGGVEISSSEIGAQHYWTFGTDGTLTFPDSTVQSTAWTGITGFGEGFSLTAADKIVTNKLYSTNLTQPTQHYRLELDTNGVVVLPDGSIINGSTIRGVAGTGELNYTGITIGPNINDAEKTWMWVDHANAYVSTNNAAHTWTFGNDGALTLPNGDLNIFGNKIRNVSVVDDLSSGSEIEVTLAKTVITHGVTNSLGGGGGSPSLTSRSIVDVGDGKVVMAYQVINDLGGDPSLTAQKQIEVSGNNVLIGQKTINTSGASTLTAFSGWTFDDANSRLILPAEGYILDTNGTPGLTRKTYTAVTGWFNNDSTWFSTNATVASTTVITGTIQGLETVVPGYAEQLYGYFKAPSTATYTFGLHVDDAGMFWIGDDAVDGSFDDANANITYVWPNTVATYSVALTKDVYYPVRLQWGNNDGTAPNFGSLGAFWYSTDGGTTPETDFTNTIYTGPGLTTVSKGGHEWTFSTDGTTFFPDGTNFGEINGAGTIGFAANPGSEFTIDTTGGSWSFGNDGELSLPTNAYTEAVIKELDATALVLFAQSAGGNIKLLAGATSAAGAKQWLFNGTDGSLTLPTDGTVSYTPTTTTDWNGTAPTTMQAAIDRLAAAFKILNSGTGA
jgi:hypothetical protein